MISWNRWPIWAMYFCLNFTQELATTAMSLILINELKLEPTRITIYYTTVFFPYTIRPVYAFVSDNIPLFRYRRRPYVFICAIGAGLSYVSVALFGVSEKRMFALGITISVFLCFAEVVVDSITVEIGNMMTKRTRRDANNMQAIIQSECMMARTVGSLFAAALSILLLSLVSPRAVVAITGLSNIVTFAVAILLPEGRVVSGFFRRTAAVFHDWSVLRQRTKFYAMVVKMLYLPILFVFFYNAGPTVDDAYSYLITSNVYTSFSNWELSLLKFVGIFGSLAGTLIYWKWMSEANLRRVFVVCTIGGVVAGLSRIVMATDSTGSIGVSNSLYVSFDSFLISLAARLAFMPGLVLAAQSCPKGIEAIIYSIFSSTSHVASLLSSFLSAQLTASLGIERNHFGNLWLMIIICSAVHLVPLLMLPFVPVKPFILRTQSGTAAVAAAGAIGGAYEYGGIVDTTYSEPDHHSTCSAKQALLSMPPETEISSYSDTVSVAVTADSE
jgi:BT1 family